ncbi:MAG: CoA transferase [Chloroflexota bacterium]|nr:CoA transferase [Chloroflexota bacterium]MDE2896041.1 CoA transferase [Chloroflexota bacterium]
MTEQDPDQAAGALDGVRVIECSETSAGAYCGRLLAGLGASVTLIEPPLGHPMRRSGPFRADVPDREGGASHLHLQRHKQSIRLNVASGAGRRMLDQHLSKADVLIIDVDRRRWQDLGLQPEAVIDRHPDLQVCTITPFGTEGPRSDWRGSELTLYAAGGYLRIGGEPEREPVKAWGEQGHMQAGLHAALGIVTALYAQAGGQLIDTAIFEAVAFLLGGGHQHAWFFDREPVRNGARLVGFGPGHLYPSTIRPCQDGWVHAHCNNRYPEAMAVLFDQPQLAAPDLLASLMGRADEVDELMEPVLAATPRREIVRRAQELRIPFTEVLAPSEVLADDDGHHAARDFWQTTPHPRGGDVLAPGPALRLGRTAWVDGVAPRLGEHNGRLGTPKQRVQWRRAGVA